MGFCSKVHPLTGERTYSYNLQGWPKTQEVLLYGQPEAFQMSLRHYDPDDPQAEPLFGGFVSEAVSKHMILGSMIY